VTPARALSQVSSLLPLELLSKYLDTMLQFTAATTLPNSVRSLAFEIITNFAEVPHNRIHPHALCEGSTAI
jgi:hypothetical protein